ncbi:hypothetical protein [Microbacterium sp. C7(2022)]|uniref:hypothetical protein n=1 Tax=Microbacterium sp. C7(2022) TaxID=2992759 RepID=UPI00237AEF2A|nr:hypothetical protein [Microbacterium sp. C7(2022)]
MRKGLALPRGETRLGTEHKDAAWSYPTPYPSAFDRVGKDFSVYVAFAPGVTITD